MKVNCKHGFFTFDEMNFGDASRFYSKFGLELLSYREKFTFAALAVAPEHCISGQTYLGAACTVSFGGEPHEIFEANGLIYDFVTGVVVQKSTITKIVDLEPAGFYFISPGLILPGSLTKGGSKITGYSAHFSFDTLRFRYSEVIYD